MKSGRGWLYALMVAILIFSAFYWYHQRHLTETTTVTWYSNRPVVWPNHTQSLSFGTNAHDQTVSVPLLPGAIAGGEWYLPITAHSAVSYALHDGQGRWLYQDHRYNLANAPTDPIGTLTAAPNGHSIAWVLNNQIHWLHPGGTITIVPHGHAPNLTNQGLEYVTSAGATHQISSPYPTRFAQYDTATSPDPFVDGGNQFVFDNHGTVNQLALATGHIAKLFSVNPNHWPAIVSTISFSQGVAVLMNRQAPIPAYLLVLSTSHGTYWYRWPAALTPELGVTDGGTLIVAGIEPSLVAFGQGALHTLPESSNLFSNGPKGVVLANSQGGFINITRVSF